MNNKIHYLSFAVLIAFSESVFAHTGLLSTGDFADGFQHPFIGLDHFLAMFGFGLYAAGRSSAWAGRMLALTVVSMAAGAWLGSSGFMFAYVEPALVVSLLAVGFGLTVGTAKLNQFVVPAAISAFAAVHGFAHGAEMPAAATAYPYLAGVVSASALLFAAGFVAAFIATRTRSVALIKLYGGVTALFGIWLLTA